MPNYNKYHNVASKVIVAAKIVCNIVFEKYFKNILGKWMQTAIKWEQKRILIKNGIDAYPCLFGQPNHSVHADLSGFALLARIEAVRSNTFANRFYCNRMW